MDLYRVVDALLTHVATYGKPKAKYVRIPYRSLMPPDVEFNDCDLILKIEAYWDTDTPGGDDVEDTYNWGEQ